MTQTGRITVTLPADRRKPGTLTFTIGAWSQFTCVCLGKSDNAKAAEMGNPERDPLLPWGDLPTGEYFPSVMVARPGRAFGLCERIHLLPIDGQAEHAADFGGRYGLLIHGGEPSASELLRPTYGCLRLFDHDMAVVLAMFNEAKPCTVHVVEV